MTVQSRAPRASRWIPWAFVGFFAAVAAIQGVMIWLAVASFSGLATDSPYERGLDYNETLAAKAEEAALGWQVEARFLVDASAGSTRAGRLELALLGRDGRPIESAAVAARLRRPVGSEATIELRLDATEPGRYTGAAELPLAGQWDLDLDIEGPGGKAHYTQRIFVP